MFFAINTVLVEGERIVQVGPAAEVVVPSQATVVDGRGRFLIPGLADMHEHLPRGDTEWESSLDDYFDLHLAAGVTTLRTMRGQDGDVALRDALARGQRSGPRLIVGSPGLDAETAPDPQAAIERVRAFHGTGFDFVKVLGGFDLATFRAAATEARRLGIPLAGHVPSILSMDEVLTSYWTTEHLHGHAAESHSGVAFAALVQQTAKSGLWVCPTLGFQVSWYGQESIANMDQWPGMQYAHPKARADWTESASKHLVVVRRALKLNTAKMKARYTAVRALADAGVGLLASSSGGWFLMPGFSMFVEFRHLAVAGLSPAQILEAATLQAARSVGQQNQWGSVRPGLVADLVLVDANPLEDIENVERVTAVVRRGQLFDRAELDRRLAAIVAGY